METITNMKAITGQYFLSKNQMREYFLKHLSQKAGYYWHVFILINRKGYWDYKIFFPEGYQIGKDQCIYSDRYLDKLPRNELRKLLQGKMVVLYDDSLTNGGNLFSYYLLCKSFGAKEVFPIVYALNSSFPTEKSYRIMKQEADVMENQEFWDNHSKEDVIQEFVSKIKYKLLLGNCDIDRMSIWQTMLYQKNVSPLVMDLPIFNHVTGSDEKKITLEWNQFRQLCSAQSLRWNFVENSMRGWEETVEASYFHFNSQLVDERLKGMFHDFVVKCKYHRNGNKVDVVFTPFAIVKSNSFENVYSNFKLLYENTDYGDDILKRFQGEENPLELLEKDAHLCKNIFRAVIFRLSDYIGRQFQQFVKDVLDVDIEYDWKIMKDNFGLKFISTQQKFYEEYDEIAFEKLILQCRVEADIYPYQKALNLSKEKRKATQERINIYVRKRICQKKNNNGEGKTPRDRIYMFETIQCELEERFSFKDENELRRMLTNTILLFLETNSFSNYIYVDAENHILYRGFRFGENSEIFLHESLWYFYAFLYAYYLENDIKQLQAKYDDFMDWLKYYLEKEGNLGIWITEDGFQFLRDHFGEMDNDTLLDEILRRRYLLDCRADGEEDVKAVTIRKAAVVVKQLGRM